VTGLSIDVIKNQIRLSKMFVGSEAVSTKALKEIYKELLKRNGMTMTEASQLLGLSTPQQLNNKFNNKKVSLSDLKDFLGIMGYDYEIIIKKRSGSF
jgi:hypothetical protein